MRESLFGSRYRTIEKIGSGGMADVYRASDEVLDRTIALKVMHAALAADPEFAERFRREAHAAASLSSPNIVSIYDWGQDGDTYFIAMELVRGSDLKDIESVGALPAVQVAEIGAQVCSALRVAHGQDVIHRDIKPHNIMVQPDGTVKVMDFGIARAGNTTLTQTGSVLGTAQYLSPEQAQGRPLTAASDLYSLGVVLYEAATGVLPFSADTPVAVALMQVTEEAARPRDVNPDIDPGLEAVIVKAMRKSITERYTSADDLRHDLLAVAAGRAFSADAETELIPVIAKTSVMPVVVAPVADRVETDAAAIRRAERTQRRRDERVKAESTPRRSPRWVWALAAALIVAAGFGLAIRQANLGGGTAKSAAPVTTAAPSPSAPRSGDAPAAATVTVVPTATVATDTTPVGKPGKSGKSHDRPGKD